MYTPQSIYNLVSAANTSLCIQYTTPYVQMAVCAINNTQQWNFTSNATLISAYQPTQDLSAGVGCTNGTFLAVGTILGDSSELYSYNATSEQLSTCGGTLCAAVTNTSVGALVTTATCNASDTRQSWLFGV